MNREEQARKQLETEAARLPINAAFGESPSCPPSAYMKGKKVKGPTQKGMKKKSGKRS